MRTWIVLFTLFSYITLTSNINANADLDTLSITIDGINYSLDVHPSYFGKQVTVEVKGGTDLEFSADIEFYRGIVTDIPNSWITLSNYQSKWSGFAYAYGRYYDIQDTIASPVNISAQLATSSPMLATELALTKDIGNVTHFCPLDHTNIPASDASLAVLPDEDANSSSPAIALAVAGITTAANVALALDHFYVARFGNNSVARAMQILDTVDMIYRDDLSVALNNINIEVFANRAAFPVAEADKDNTDANELLNAVLNNQNLIFNFADRTLGALLTSRDLEVDDPLISNGVAGIAPLDATCRSFGGLPLAVSVNEDRNGQAVASVIVAHEMGHNFGAVHDATGSAAACPAGQFIMSPFVFAAATDFSTCSQDDIAAHIASGNCYRDPIDMVLNSLAVTPPIITTEGDQVVRTYNVQNATSIALSNIDITGMLQNLDDSGNPNAEFTGVTLDAAPCTVTGNRQSYTCRIAAIAGNNAQTFFISETITATGLNRFTATAQYANVPFAQRVDIEPDNSSLATTMNIVVPTTAPQAANSLRATALTNGNIQLVWNDNSNNEQNFILERSEDNGQTFIVITTAQANQTNYTDSVVTQDVTYSYTVTAANAVGQAPASNTSTATAGQPPVANTDSGGGGGGAFYLMTLFLLFARVLTAIDKFRI